MPSLEGRWLQSYDYLLPYEAVARPKQQGSNEWYGSMSSTQWLVLRQRSQAGRSFVLLPRFLASLSRLDFSVADLVLASQLTRLVLSLWLWIYHRRPFDTKISSMSLWVPEPLEWTPAVRQHAMINQGHGDEREIKPHGHSDIQEAMLGRRGIEASVDEEHEQSRRETA